MGCTRRQTVPWKESVTMSTDIATNSAMLTIAQKRKRVPKPHQANNISNGYPV